MSLLLWKPPLFFLARNLKFVRDDNGEPCLSPDTDLVSPVGEDGVPRLAVFTTKQLANEYSNRHEGPSIGVECVEIPTHDHFAWLLEQIEDRYSAIFLDMSPETDIGTAYKISDLLGRPPETGVN